MRLGASHKPGRSVSVKREHAESTVTNLPRKEGASRANGMSHEGYGQNAEWLTFYEGGMNMKLGNYISTNEVPEKLFSKIAAIASGEIYEFSTTINSMSRKFFVTLETVDDIETASFSKTNINYQMNYAGAKPQDPKTLVKSFQNDVSVTEDYSESPMKSLVSYIAIFVDALENVQ